jgi:sulfoxide reductase heme-binding subunit YedZ
MFDATTSALRRPASGWLRAMPWCDGAGRFSAFKLIALILLCVPAAMIAVRYADGALGPRAINAALHEIGNWTLRLMLLSLAVRPARTLLQWPRLMQLRRMVGVTAFVYAAAHLLLYMADEAFDLQKVASEIVLRIYLTIGFVALLVLTAMAVTSTDGMARRLGGRRWRLLHQLVYGAALLSVIHFFMQTKVTVDEPWIMAGLFAWLMAWRAAVWRARSGLPDWLPAAFAVGAGIATALGESVYYWIKLGVSPGMVLAANLDSAAGSRPAWVVAAICLGFAMAGIVRNRLPQRS